MLVPALTAAVVTLVIALLLNPDDLRPAHIAAAVASVTSMVLSVISLIPRLAGWLPRAVALESASAAVAAFAGQYLPVLTVPLLVFGGVSALIAATVAGLRRTTTPTANSIRSSTLMLLLPPPIICGVIGLPGGGELPAAPQNALQIVGFVGGLAALDYAAVSWLRPLRIRPPHAVGAFMLFYLLLAVIGAFASALAPALALGTVLIAIVVMLVVLVKTLK